MRYIKTFESFYHEDDMSREIASFLDDCSITPFEMNENDNPSTLLPVPGGDMDMSMLRLYKVDGDVETPNFKDALDALSSYMEGERGLFVSMTNNSLGNTLAVTEVPLEDALTEWLNKNYGEMEKVESIDFPGSTILRCGERKNFLFYNNGKEKGSVNQKIWTFIERIAGTERTESILKKWFSETYGIGNPHEGSIAWINPIVMRMI